MSAFKNILDRTRNFILKFPLLNQAREMHWAVSHSNKVLESMSADIRRLADKADSHVALTEKLLNIMADEYVDKHLERNPRYSEPGRLGRHERQVFSQSGEDGIIEEIFDRIGTTNRFVVEFGVGNGLENNSAFLLVKGWTGLWIEANEKWCRDIESDFHELLKTKQLLLRKAFITAENIESLLNSGDVPEELDLLSIDIDGNDYWVWKAVANYRPRVVVIEYNAQFSPQVRWVMRYNPQAVWKRTTYQGASLKSLEILGKEKGYQLVGCSFVGTNAFFVRTDLVGNAFCAPFTAENHYEPARFHLIRTAGHARGFGEFVQS
jgi:hypothetical protein